VTQRVLVLCFSQSGQLERGARAFTEPLVEAGHEVHLVPIVPETAYPFPWSITAFFGMFPEVFLGRTVPLKPAEIPGGSWDLVVVASTIWFLSPSQPWWSFLHTEQAARLFAGQRVVTLVGCRNMWIRGWRKLVRRLNALGADVTDRVVVTHSGSVFASYFSTLAWMLTGKRKAIEALPRAEIDEAAYARVRGFGQLLADNLAAEGPFLEGHETASISHAHALGEQLVGRTMFPLQAHIGALVAPDGLLRQAFAVWQMVSTISAVLVLVLPMKAFRWLFRARVDPWLEGLARLPVAEAD
jgi:hypothetical protein